MSGQSDIDAALMNIYDAASATVTIHVDDVNDHTPHFVRSLYRATMSESLDKGASVTSVSATDNDIGVNARLTLTSWPWSWGYWSLVTLSDIERLNARLTYTLAERDREYFYISTVDATNTGVIKVFKVRDVTQVCLTVTKYNSEHLFWQLVKILFLLICVNILIFHSYAFAIHFACEPPEELCFRPVCPSMSAWVPGPRHSSACRRLLLLMWMSIADLHIA